MKKYFVLLCLLFLPFILCGQQNNYIDVTKKDTVTVAIISDNKEQTATNNSLQEQFAKIVENQNVVNQSVADGLQSLSATVPLFIKQVEEKNKSDCEFVLSKLGFPEDRVKHVIKIERWLNFITVTLISLYVFLTIWDGAIRGKTIKDLFVPAVIFTILGAASYILMLKFLTLLFNGDYYVIKELIKLYT